MSQLDTLAGRYPDEWLAKLRAFEASVGIVDLDSDSVSQWPVAREIGVPIQVAGEMLRELVEVGWGELIEEFWECPICRERHDSRPIEDLCATLEHSFTERGDPGPNYIVAIRRDGIEFRYVGWLYALHGMASLGEWQEAFSWNVSVTYGRMVPIRIQKYGFRTLGVLAKFSQRRMVEAVAKTLRDAKEEASEVTDAEPDVIAHSFGTWLIGHALQTHEDLKIGRLILLGSALRPDFDWGTLFRRQQVEAVLNHYGTRDRVIPLGHFFVPDAGPSGRRGFDKPVGWGRDLPDPAKVIINRSQAEFSHSEFFDEENLETMFADFWRPFLRYSDLDLYPERPEAPWPATRWKPMPWPLRAILGGPSRTW